MAGPAREKAEAGGEGEEKGAGEEEGGTKLGPADAAKKMAEVMISILSAVYSLSSLAANSPP